MDRQIRVTDEVGYVPLASSAKSSAADASGKRFTSKTSTISSGRESWHEGRRRSRRPRTEFPVPRGPERRAGARGVNFLTLSGTGCNFGERPLELLCSKP
jgi:hypothetical protein